MGSFPDSPEALEAAAEALEAAAALSLALREGTTDVRREKRKKKAKGLKTSMTPPRGFVPAAEDSTGTTATSSASAEPSSALNSFLTDNY